MFETVTAEKSLLFLEDDLLVNEFKALARKLPQYHSIPQAGTISSNDVWVAAFNIWLLLQPDEYLILESVEKTLYYSSNFIILDELKNDHYFKFIKTHPDIATELLFITALYLAEALSQWLTEVLLAENREDIIIRNRRRSYFEAHKGSDEEVRQFVEDQAAIVKIIMPILTKENTLERLIKNSYDEASTHFHKKNIVVEN
ncbi:hypothetical protein [Metasolibacillus sp. FSL K6-0083]|uniref:hypothetical protein n=1 Tax=Metasolibacillus sp. FSL K6-0083 TaxID=2921416 RepID=UPI00079AA276|nr:hypothetical protein A0U40_04715 [[Bacillus] sp. KCTC 13219]